MAELTPGWLAGFFDGEGMVDIRVAKSHGGKYIRFELRCQITQKDRGILERIQSAYGGSIQGGKCNAWVATGPTAASFLRAIVQHTICKTEQIKVGLRYQERLASPGDRMTASGRRGFFKLSQEEMDARLALQRELRGIRDSAGLRPKARNYSVQAEAAVYALPRGCTSMEDCGGAQASGEDRGLH
tara:strand:- start:236 stop:793 length:558 start_codon:yes stop_codon:yes gene_type:complete